ncbi:MAG TPA: hypothetical protein VHN14_17725 [Kofleriaceae bacterium]|nr:hypothetical protein [Kofleriaceae bacterium]
MHSAVETVDNELQTAKMTMHSAVEMVGNELRNVVAFWRERFEDGTIGFPVPSFVTWTFARQQPLVEGQVLGVFVWPDATQTQFIAPPGCHGAVVDIGNGFDTELFHHEPAQFLLRLQR